MARPTTRGTDRLLSLFLWSAVLLPLTIILHEGAHWAIGRAGGFATQLHFGSVSGIPEQPPFAGAPIWVALSTFAGPAMTLALIAFGVAMRHRAWGIALVAAALTRFVVNAIFLVQQALVLARIAQPSEPNFDEVVTARALGWPPQSVAAIGALVFIFGLVWLWRRASGWTILALLLGCVLGMFGWLALLGPRLLP